MRAGRIAAPGLSVLVIASLAGGVATVHAREDAGPRPAASPGAVVSPALAPLASPVRLRAPALPPELVSRTTGGRLAVVGGAVATTPVADGGRYAVEVDVTLAHLAAEFAAVVDATLADPRGWSEVDGRAFRRVHRGPVAFRVVLAAPDLTDRLCRPLATNGRYSCFQRGRAVINVHRWVEGTPAYGVDLLAYRAYLVNHEVGHALGRGHRRCPAPGRAAPVMVQQTKGLGGCRPNAWPTTG